MPFATLFQLYQCSQGTYPCFSGVNFTSTQHHTFSKEGRNQCGKRRKCLLPAFSPFPTMFPKGYFLRVVRVVITSMWYRNREYVYSAFLSTECCRISKISNVVERIDNFQALARKLSFLSTECCRISKISNEVERIDNFRALARKLSFLSTELDIFDIRQHYVRNLFIFQRLIC